MIAHVQLGACTALWTFALTFAIVASIEGSLVMMFWACEATILAGIASLYLLLAWVVRSVATQERLRTEEIAELIAAKAIEQVEDEGVTHIH